MRVTAHSRRTAFQAGANSGRTRAPATTARAAPGLRCSTDRRALFFSVASVAFAPGASQADVLQSIAKQLTRPDNVTPVDAVISLLDAASVLREIQGLADTPLDSTERFEARALLPGMAKRLRQVGPAVGVLVSSGGASDAAAFSELYGGSAQELSAADFVYNAIGSTITLSGRTIRDEALVFKSTVATEAKAAVLNFIATLPDELVTEAREQRAKRYVK